MHLEDALPGYELPEYEGLPPAIVGVSGRIAAGKTTVCKRLASNTGWKLVNLGEYIKALAAFNGPVGRKELQELGTALVDNSPEEFCFGVLDTVKWIQGEGLVIDGVRNLSVVNSFRRLVAPTKFILLFLRTSDSVRLTRYSGRHQLSDSLSLIDAENHYIERETAALIPAAADIIVNGDMREEDVFSEVKLQIYNYLRGSKC